MHAGGIDAPVGMVKAGTPIVLHRNWRGLFAFSIDITGEQTTCTPDDSPPSGCDDFPWPARAPWSYWYDLEAHDTHLWYGSLPLGQIDETGLSYLRNRYYDGLTGQFTQEDRIGLAGGLNLFGYAGGDPINFADPFGLCPPEDTNLDDCPIGSEDEVELLRAYAFLKARRGGAWLQGLVDLGVEVTVASDPNSCRDGSRGCTNSTTGDITLESATDHAETATRLVHEITHAWLRAQPQWCPERQEVIAWKNALSFYEQSGANVPFYETRLNARNANPSAFFSTYRGRRVC